MRKGRIARRCECVRKEGREGDCEIVRKEEKMRGRLVAGGRERRRKRGRDGGEKDGKKDRKTA